MPPFQQSVDVCSNFDVSGMVLAFAATTITGHTTHHQPFKIEKHALKKHLNHAVKAD